MVESIFDFWNKIDRGDNIHPADEGVFRRLDFDGHGFNQQTLPGCFMGRLRTAPVVLLFMSPGLSSEDEISARSIEWQDWHVRQREGNENLPSVDAPVRDWWLRRTKFLGVADKAVIASKVAFLNIGAYKSKEMNDPELLAALPSSRVSLDWAQSELFPAAESGERVVICLRAAKFWGLHPGKIYRGTLFAPRVNRAGDMLKKEPADLLMRERIVESARTALGLAA